jgi:hypothetical protein
MARRAPTHIGIANPPPPLSRDAPDAPARIDYKVPAGATAALYAEKRFDGPTRILESDVTIGTSPAPILGNNPRRVAWTITNNGSSDVGTGFTLQVTTAQSFKLAASGGVQRCIVEQDGEEVTYPLFGISGSAGQNVHIVEVIRI